MKKCKFRMEMNGHKRQSNTLRCEAIEPESFRCGQRLKKRVQEIADRTGLSVFEPIDFESCRNCIEHAPSAAQAALNNHKLNIYEKELKLMMHFIDRFEQILNPTGMSCRVDLKYYLYCKRELPNLRNKLSELQAIVYA